MRFTEDFPAFAEALMVDRIDDVDDSVAVPVVLGPYGADTALAAEIPELEYCRGQGNLPGCTRRGRTFSYFFKLRCRDMGEMWWGHDAYCSGPLSGQFYPAVVQEYRYIWS